MGQLPKFNTESEDLSHNIHIKILTPSHFPLGFQSNKVLQRFGKNVSTCFWSHQTSTTLYVLECQKKQLKLIKGYCESTLFVETLVWVKAFNWPCSCNFHALLWVKSGNTQLGQIHYKVAIIFSQIIYSPKNHQNFLIMCYLLFHLMNLQCFASLTKA